jgi:hypothetical protein
MVTCPDLPFNVAVVVPEAVPEFRTIPLPAADDTKFPAVAVIFPEVAVSVVVAVTDPGATNAEGILNVTVDPDAAVVISDAVPEILMLFADGVAVPVSPVSVFRAPLALSKRVQVGVVRPFDVAMLVRM